MRDQGARKLILVFSSVVLTLLGFYSYLGWRALIWSPAFFIVTADSKPSDPISARESELFSPLPPAVERGRRLYLEVGCAVCHGPAGEGGVRNPNYVKETIPALDTLVERMVLYDPEDVGVVLKALASLRPGESLKDAEEVDVPRAPVVIAQYESIRDVILGGNPAGRKEPSGHPPLDMPAWNDKLTPAEVNDVIAYLLSLYPWESEPGGEP